MPSSDRNAAGQVATGDGAPAAPAEDAPVVPVQQASPPASTAGGLRQMHPAYFAMAMATGIVSVSCHLLGFLALAVGLFWLNVAIYLGLWALTALRLARYPAEVLADLTSHSR